MSMDSTKGAPGKEATFRDLLQFPCSFSFRVIGGDIDGMEEKIIGCLKEQFDRSPLAPVTRTLSRKGTYASYAVTVEARSEEDLKSMYSALGRLETVRCVL